MTTTRFLIDAQLPPKLASEFLAAGFDAVHVSNLGLLKASDAAIWRTAVTLNAVIVTKDEDFVLLAKQDTSGPPVLWVRIGNTANHELSKRLTALLAQIIAALEAGERVIEIS